MRLVLGGCLAAALLSLLIGGHPTYDPWAWIIWGREIVEGDLDTRSGPSWKPLPMLFTIPFALAGDEVAPSLWLVIARAGGLLALVMAFRLGRRLAGAGAGVVAAAGLLLSEGFVRHAARGFSEGLLVGLVLLALDRHLEGRRAQAFLAGTGAALLRPEVWPFWGAYGLWLAWTHPRSRALVAAGFASIPLGWFVPEYLGSGDFFRAAARAREPNLDSPAFAERPFLAVMEQSAGIVALPIYIGAAIAIGLALRRREARGLLLACAAGAAALMIAVGLMTEAGFAGNLRYVVLPAALVCVLAGAGWLALLRLAGRWSLLVALVAAVAFVPVYRDAASAFADDMRSVRSEWDFESRLTDTIRLMGGPEVLNACGSVFTGRFQVPSVAWRLHRHQRDVEIFAFPPGWVLAPRGTRLAEDPRFEHVRSTAKWIVRRNCGGAGPA